MQNLITYVNHRRFSQAIIVSRVEYEERNVVLSSLGV